MEIPGIPRAACVTFLPAEPGVPQDPILVVVEVDFSVGWEEGVGQFPRGAVEAVVGQGLQAVRVVDGVETWGEKQWVEGDPAGSACPGNPWLTGRVSDGIPGVFQPPGPRKGR